MPHSGPSSEACGTQTRLSSWAAFVPVFLDGYSDHGRSASANKNRGKILPLRSGQNMLNSTRKIRKPSARKGQARKAERGLQTVTLQPPVRPGVLVKSHHPGGYTLAIHCGILIASSAVYGLRVYGVTLLL